jgi:hypothetical protein
MSPITKHTVIVRADDLAVTDLDGETVVLDVETGVYYGLNTVGTQVFTMAEEPVPVSEVVEQLRSGYEVAGDRLRQDVLAFLNKMQAHGLIHATEEHTA